MSTKQVEKLIEALGIVVADPNPHMRKLTRMMLMNVGAKLVYEASDGLAAVDIVRTANPDVLLLDWDMPMMSGADIMHMVRSPGVFPKPGLPVIMLTERALRSKVQQAMRLGVNEFLVKPTSPGALRDRLLSIMLCPRPMVRVGEYFVPQPRRPLTSSDLRKAA
jgi:two-component system, chemotaxis family, chemotaxis protein CheY